MGYYLAQQGCDFLILDANERVGDSWRKRWDSLRLFTPAGYSGLPGMSFGAPAGRRPTKDETADYLEEYATRFSLPVRAGFGLPLLYFLLHGAAMLIERRGKPMEGVRGRLWTILWLVIPLPILFHPWFLKGVLWPLVGIGFE